VPIVVLSHRPPGSLGGELSIRDVCDRRDRWRRRLRPGAGTCWCSVRTRRNGRSRPVGWTSCRSTRSGAVRSWPSAVRGVAVARRAGDRSGDRHAGGHSHPLPRPSLSRSTSGLLGVVGRGELADQAWARIDRCCRCRAGGGGGGAVICRRTARGRRPDQRLHCGVLRVTACVEGGAIDGLVGSPYGRAKEVVAGCQSGAR
jgi:hypothetical protein